jgi:MobA/MobL family
VNVEKYRLDVRTLGPHVDLNFTGAADLVSRDDASQEARPVRFLDHYFLDSVSDVAASRAREHFRSAREIVLPADLVGNTSLHWTRDPYKLWSVVDNAGSPENGTLAHEFEARLPCELSFAGRLRLADTFARELADRYHVAVDLTLPRQGNSVYLLLPNRTLTDAGLGNQSDLDLPDPVRRARGLDSYSAEIMKLKRRWSELATAGERRRQA